MSEEEKLILYKALKVYALIISQEKSYEECKKFLYIMEKLGDVLEYDFSDI